MIDHINDIRDDKRLKNLQLITNKDNSNRVNADNAKIVCEGINNCKSGKSKKDSCNYEFKYIEEKRHE